MSSIEIMTRLQQWQFDSDMLADTLSTHLTLPFDNTLRMIMVNHIRKYYESNNIIDPIWGNYIRSICRTMDAWRTSPDPELNDLWHAKFEYLSAFYMEIGNVYSVHCHEPILSDIYKEKVDQAMDCLTGKGDVYPLVEMDANRLDITFAEASTNILEHRKRWLTVMTAIEEIRLKGTDAILSLEESEDLMDVCTQYTQEMQQMLTWT